MRLQRLTLSRDPLPPGFMATGELSAAEVDFFAKHQGPTALGTALGSGYWVQVFMRSGTVVWCRSCHELWRLPHAAADSTADAAEIRSHGCVSRGVA